MERLGWLYFLLFISLLHSTSAQLLDLNREACLTMDIGISRCLERSPDLSSATSFATLASCLCYPVNTDTWAPYVYDNYALSCLSYFSSASPEYIRSFTAAGNRFPTAQCELAGNVLSAAATLTDTIVPDPRTTNPSYRACISAKRLQSNCLILTPSLTTARTDITAMASCLCYSVSTWMPTVYDNLIGSCYSWYSSMEPEQYAEAISEGLLTSPCVTVGDVRAGASLTPLSSIRPSSVVNTGVATPTASIKSTSASEIVQVPGILFVLLASIGVTALVLLQS